VIGERLGPYRIVELLGRGGLSEVYRAYHQETAQDVALKILQNAPDLRTRTRFMREAEALQVLHHPNIIEILSVGEFQDRPYFTMPFVRVLNLQEVMQQRFQVDRGTFSQDEILRITLDVARALRYSHGKGIIHRDVKPGNILLDPSFRPVLCDFGLARLAGAETVTRQGTMLGTPKYMAPEQLQGRRCDPRSDLYSLGLIAYEMATGSIPFDGPEPLGAAVRRLTETIPDLASQAPHLDLALTSLIMDLLAKNPTQRPHGAGGVVKVLEKMPGAPSPLSEGEADPPTIEDSPPSLEKELKKSPLSFVLAGGVALLVLVGLPLFLASQEGRELTAHCKVIPDSSGAHITFQANRPVFLSVRFGPPGQMFGLKEPPGEASREHQIHLEELSPNTDYAFSLLLREPGGRVHEEAIKRFRTASK
jgi:serine/threonine-protein kinase